MSPAFVFWSRQGIFVTNIVVTLAVAVVWTGVRWLRTGRPIALYLTAVLAGLGLWSKLLFVWVLGAIVGMLLAGGLFSWLAGVDFGLRPRKHPARRPWRTALIAVGLFLLTLIPLLLYNQQTAGTFQSVFGNLDRSYYGIQNAAFLDNLAVRLDQILALLRGDFLWYLGGPFANRWAPLLAVGVYAIAVAMAAIDAGDGRNRRALPVLILAALFVLLLVLQSSFTVSGLFITHFAIIQPFVVLLVALAAGYAGQSARWRLARNTRQPSPGGRVLWRATMVGLALAVAVWFAADLATSMSYHLALAQNGGQVTHSDAISRLAHWLDERNVKQPLALDWGIDAQIRYLTENRVEPLEIFGYDRLDAPDDGFAARVAQFLDDPSRLYIVRMPENTVFAGRREALEAIAATNGLKLTMVEAFYDRSGKTMFVVLAVGPVQG